ncbi:MAG: type II secretion system GspH family protein [Synergistaceae bacterium]|jgi:general secretion pathway protein G|nr:type II secretion system GspH family protein [Synergistaceae bacterium]
MKKILKARKSGFTLVELLIVIMIIAILAGMMMIATGSATDSAEAAKLINDLRSAKSASLLFYVDEGEWPSEDNADTRKSLDKYCDRPMFDDALGKYDLDIAIGATDTVERYVIGISPKAGSITTGVKAKLESGANKSSAYVGRYPEGFSPTGGQPNYIYMYMK